MKRISLARIPFEIPVLGFGCSSLTGTSRKNAIRLLETAFDNGIRHFDVARYYGYGQAEGILGSFAHSHRHEITITSKFGLQPPSRTSPLRLLISSGRRFVRLVPRARKFFQKRAGALVTIPPFNAAECQRSLETSLRELRTDYLDFFLLHDYSPHSQTDELFAMLQSLVAGGKIRFFGVGTSFSNVLRTLATQPQFCEIVQFENSILQRNISNLPPDPRARLVITHSALAGAFSSLVSFLKANPTTAQFWSTQLSANCEDESILAGLLLNWAAAANPNGLVLFSTRSPARMVRNINSVMQAQASPAQISLFAMLVEDAKRSGF